MLSLKYFLHSRFLSVIKVFSFFPLLSPDCLRWLVMSGRLFAGELTRPRTMDWPITLHTDTHADKQSLGLQCLVLIVKHWITRQILTQLYNLTEILSVEKNRNECALKLFIKVNFIQMLAQQFRKDSLLGWVMDKIHFWMTYNERCLSVQGDNSVQCRRWVSVSS